MRPVALFPVIALALSAPAAAQERAPDQRCFGSDTLFGPGMVDLGPTGSAVRLRLTRPAHVLALELTATGAARLVLPRGAESRLSRPGASWLDVPLPLSVTGAGAATTTFIVGRVTVRGDPLPAAPSRGVRDPIGPTPAPAPAGGTAVLLIASDSAWRKDAVLPLLPSGARPDLLALATELVTALTEGRPAPWAAYFARW